jgi:LPXTG-motif cell wall-anchored protein
MSDGNDINYWNLIFIGAMILGALLLYFSLKKKPRDQEMNDPTSNAGAKRVYEEEQRIHERDPSSGL